MKKIFIPVLLMILFTLNSNAGEFTGTVKYGEDYEVFFEENSDSLSSEIKNLLDEVYFFVQSNEEYRVMIKSRQYIDEEVNICKSRAKNMKDYLVAKGLEEKRIFASGRSPFIKVRDGEEITDEFKQKYMNATVRVIK